MIVITCSGAVRDPHELREVDWFERPSIAGVLFGWSEQSVKRGRAERTLVGDQLLTDRMVSQYLERRVVDRTAVLATRLRYRFICEDCSRTVEAKHEKLVPILDTLAENGLTSVSLSALAARV